MGIRRNKSSWLFVVGFAIATVAATMAGQLIYKKWIASPRPSVRRDLGDLEKRVEALEAEHGRQR